MKQRAHRWLTWLAIFLGGGAMFQVGGFGASGLNSGCTRFISNGALSTTNFCFLLDCDNGFLGGLIDPCNDPSSGATLVDCPSFVPAGEEDQQTQTQNQNGNFNQ